MAETTTTQYQVQKYLTLVKLHPESAEAHFGLGMAYEEAGQTADANKEYEQAIKLDSKHAKSYLHRGFLLARGAELKLALEEWRKAFKNDPNLHMLFSDPDTAAMYKKKIGSAIQQFERPIVVNPKDSFAHYQLGSAYKLFGRLELALQSLKRALDVNPRLWEAYEQ